MTEDAAFIWRAMCRIHWFDEQCHQALVDGRVKCFTYLSSGQEAIAAAVACAFRDKKVNLFCQHRSHSAYLSFGGDSAKLRDELLGLETGTTGGMGGDPCHTFDGDRAKMWGHDGLVASQVPIGVGMAFATKQWSVIFCGDSTVEEDIFWPSVGFAMTHKLPVLFVIEDNGLSVITETAKRRSWDALDIAEAFGAKAIELESDDSFEILDSLCDPILGVVAMKDRYPGSAPTAVMNVATCRKYKHVGHGTDGPMKWDRMQMTRQEFLDAGPQDAFEAAKIEGEAKKEMELLWKH